METSQNIENGNFPDQLTFFVEDHHAKATRWRDLEKEWMTLVETSALNIFHFLKKLSPVGYLSKMLLESCHQTKDGILEPSSQVWQNSGMGSPTQFLTLKTLESRNDVEECSLSDILEEPGDVPHKYCLTPKACLGILRRAEKRNANLPDLLKAQLEKTAKKFGE